MLGTVLNALHILFYFHTHNSNARVMPYYDLQVPRDYLSDLTSWTVIYTYSSIVHSLNIPGKYYLASGLVFYIPCVRNTPSVQFSTWLAFSWLSDFSSVSPHQTAALPHQPSSLTSLFTSTSTHYQKLSFYYLLTYLLSSLTVIVWVVHSGFCSA